MLSQTTQNNLNWHLESPSADILLLLSSLPSLPAQTHVCACWERWGAAGSLSLLAGWTLAWDWLWLPMETWSLTWNSPAQSLWGDLMSILSCNVFRVCECELSLCTGSKGRKVSLRQWQSLKMGHILNKSILTCFIFLLIWKECCEAISTGSLEWAKAHFML